MRLVMEVVGMGFVVVVVVGDSTWSGSILARKGGTCYMCVCVGLMSVGHCCCCCCIDQTCQVGDA